MWNEYLPKNVGGWEGGKQREPAGKQCKQSIIILNPLHLLGFNLTLILSSVIKQQNRCNWTSKRSHANYMTNTYVHAEPIKINNFVIDMVNVAVHV